MSLTTCAFNKKSLKEIANFYFDVMSIYVGLASNCWWFYRKCCQCVVSDSQTSSIEYIGGARYTDALGYVLVFFCKNRLIFLWQDAPYLCKIVICKVISMKTLLLHWCQNFGFSLYTYICFGISILSLWSILLCIFYNLYDLAISFASFSSDVLFETLHYRWTLSFAFMIIFPSISITERNWNMWIPGYGTEDFKQSKKLGSTEAHKQVGKICSCSQFIASLAKFVRPTFVKIKALIFNYNASYTKST